MRLTPFGSAGKGGQDVQDENENFFHIKKLQLMVAGILIWLIARAAGSFGCDLARKNN
jgi:hypothetical protein